MVLEKIYKSEFSRKRYRHTFFGPYLEDFLTPLFNQGYSPSRLGRYVQILTKAGGFLNRKRIKTVTAIRQEHVEAFLRVEAKRCTSSGKEWKRKYLSLARYVMQKMLQFLVSQGLLAPELQAPVFPLLEEFSQSLSKLRGLRPLTIEKYCCSLRKFLKYIGEDGSDSQLRKLTISQIDQYLIWASSIYSQVTVIDIGVSLRKFLQFLYQQNILKENLGQCVCLPYMPALARIPCALPLEKLAKVLEIIDSDTPKGRRDIAILQLLMTYGVRPGEIVKLRLEDVDWRNEIITFRRVKQGRTLRFPLTREVGESLLNYLRDGRPKTDAREIFIRVYAPHIPLERGSTVSSLVRLYLIEAGITQGPRGAYLFRHSLAVHLLRKGHPMKTLTDMLGHQNIESAYSYSKLAIEDLSQLCLSVKEVLP